MSVPRHHQGPWKRGKGSETTLCAVVAESPTPGSGGSDQDEVEYYGGHLIAESIAPQNWDVVAAAPKLYAALESLVREYGARGENDDLMPPDFQEPAIADAMAALAQARGEQ
jgi:hypothetical protein